jgi:DNA (cytosine-5)-methyltransferase 1
MRASNSGAAYYNEHDRFKAEWLRKLMEAGAIAPGQVDERNIQEVEASDLRGFVQCHFFAGIGVWSYALGAAGWPDDTAVWTGSCPCQSFSSSGHRRGFSDQRHLWPAWFRLIGELHPEHVLGEQVASKDGLAWFDVVSADLEGAGYIVGAADTCAAGYGAPMLGQRLYFVAEAESERRREARHRDGLSAQRAGDGGESGRMEPTDGDGRTGRLCAAPAQPPVDQLRSCPARELGASDGGGLQGVGSESDTERRQVAERPADVSGGAVRGFWAGAEWIPCRDGRSRPIEPGTFPLAHGIANRVGKLRGYGDALCAEQAKGFIEAFLKTKGWL